jgi:hypothetical protein
VNVGQLKEILKKYPDELEVVFPLYSDYDVSAEDDITLIKVVDRGFYHMRSHDTMSAENKRLEKECLCIGK